MYKLVGVLSLALFSSNSLANSTSVNPIKTYQSPQGQQLQYHTQSSLQAKSNAKNSEHVSIIVEFDEKPLFTLKNQSKSSIKKAEENLKAKRNKVLSELKAKKVTTQFTREFSRLLNGAAFDINKQDLATLKSVSGIKKIHLVQDRYIHLHDSVNLIQADSVWQQVDAEDKSITGEGITVAVLDTGIDYTREELGGCFGEDCRVKGGYDYMNEDDDPIDDDGHGTHVAGIIGAKGSVNGVAPDVDFLAYKVCDYYCPTDGIIAALEAAVDPDGDPSTDDGADIINMSLGGPGSLDDPLTVAVNALEEHDVLVVISAGNEGSGPMTIGSPGNAEYAITVASTDKTDFLADYSSRGPVFSNTFQKPDIAAPGSSIDSLAIGSGLVSYSGTSMAAPHIAGAAALVKQQRKGISARQIKSVLTSTAKPLSYSFLDAGAGRVNALDAVNSPIAISKSQIFMGRIDKSVATWTISQNVTLTNISTTEQTYTLAIPEEDKSISYDLNGVEKLTLAAGESHEITINVSVDTENVVEPGNLVHFAKLQISTGSSEANTPLLVLNAVRFDWQSDQYPESVWLNKLDGGFDTIFQYQYEGSLYLPNGNYAVSALFDNYDKSKLAFSEVQVDNQDISLSLDDIETPNQISVTSFSDHLGTAKSLSDLVGGAVYVELAHPETVKRHYHFFNNGVNWTNGLFLEKPFYTSQIPEHYELSVSMIFGDKSTLAHDYHIYAHAQTYKGMKESLNVEFDGQQQLSMTFESNIPELFNKEYYWNVLSMLDPADYYEGGFITSGAGFVGLRALTSADEISYLDNSFNIHLHTKENDNARTQAYGLYINTRDDFHRIHHINDIRLSDNGHKVNYLDYDSNVYKVNGEGLYVSTYAFHFQPEDSELWFDIQGDNQVKYHNDYLNSIAHLCDDKVYNRVFEASTNTSQMYLAPFADCDTIKSAVFYQNYFNGLPQLSKMTHTIPDYGNNLKGFESINIRELVESVTHDSEEVILTGTFSRDNQSLNDISLTAAINYQGKWIDASVELVENDWLADFSITIPNTTEPYLTALKLHLTTNEAQIELIMTGAFVLGGQTEDLALIDRDEDGIDDSVDIDFDNDGISNDIEVLSGLNPFDSSDAELDLDGDGVNNLEEAQRGRLLNYIDSDDYNDSDGDGVLDENDAFPNDPQEYADSDNDGIGNNADSDDDNDGVDDYSDAFPLDPEEAYDSDNDGIGNNADTDDDNDGVEDSNDAFPFDPYESVDTDGDGIGNNADSDDDGDGVLDANDAFPLDPSRSTNTSTPVTNPEPSSSGGGTVFWLIPILAFTYLSRIRRHISRSS